MIECYSSQFRVLPGSDVYVVYAVARTTAGCETDRDAQTHDSEPACAAVDEGNKKQKGALTSETCDCVRLCFLGDRGVFCVPFSFKTLLFLYQHLFHE